jgi:hypothetical protein
MPFLGSYDVSLERKQNTVSFVGSWEKTRSYGLV